jgi:hypothetical protein
LDLLRLGTGEEIDRGESDQLAEMLTQDFCRDFGWEAASAAGISVAIDTSFAPLAVIVSHPLEKTDPPAARLTVASHELSDHLAGSRPMQVAFASTYQLVRRPGVVWSRLVSQ